MNDDLTTLVDTQLDRDDAPAAAMALYRRLVGMQAIVPVPDADPVRFAVLAAFPGFPGVDTAAVVAIEIHANGHRWQSNGLGEVTLVEGGGENGLFCRTHGNFGACCPECAHVVIPGEDGSDALEEAVAIWCETPDSAFLACPACATWTPLPHWHSPNHDFAVGHFGITLWGTHLRVLTDAPRSHQALQWRQALGDLAGDFAVVYGRL
jgi:hypothetical protein